MCAAMQIHNPRHSYQETAAALQQALPTCLAGHMPGLQLHIGSACVYGCVHMFAWVTQLRAPSGHSMMASAPGAKDVNTAEWPESNTLQQVLADMAAEQAARGPVDVQVDGSTAAVRHWVQPLADITLSTSGTTAPTSSPTATDQCALTGPCTVESGSAPAVVLHSIYPPVLPLTPRQPGGSTCSVACQSDTGATLDIQLSAHHTQRVRVLLIEAVSGEVVVDEECQVEGGEGATNHRWVSS
jgi:hypothetical protein